MPLQADGQRAHAAQREIAIVAAEKQSGVAVEGFEPRLVAFIGGDVAHHHIGVAADIFRA